jgi:hypothetical protein
MNAWRNLAAAILRWSAAVRFGWRREARQVPLQTVTDPTFRVDVLPCTRPPLPDMEEIARDFQPDPAFVGSTVAKTIGTQASVVSLVVGGYQLRESLYLVAVRPSAAAPVPKPDTSRT